MTDALELITAVLVAIEIAIAAAMVWRNYHEVRFIELLGRLLPRGEDLPLYRALRGTARYIGAVTVYLLAITALGVAGISLAEYFPPIRAINGALLLGVLATPIFIGRALRHRQAQRLGP